MVTKDKTYIERLKCFSTLHCYKCGSTATFEKTQKGYHGHCQNPECDCQQNFSDKKAIEKVIGG